MAIGGFSGLAIGVSCLDLGYLAHVACEARRRPCRAPAPGLASHERAAQILGAISREERLARSNDGQHVGVTAPRRCETFPVSALIPSRVEVG